MRILWMKPILPYPPHQGTRRVTLQLLKNLSAEHQIRLFARLLSVEERAQVEALREEVPGLEVTAPVAPNRVSTLHRALYRFRTRASTRRGIPPVEAYTTLAPLLDAFSQEADRFHPDLVVAEYWYASRYLDRVAHLPRVLFAHDIEYRVHERAEAGALRRGPERGWGALEAAREKRALTAAPYLWFLTPGDRDTALADLNLAPDRAAVVPYGLELAGSLGPRRDGDPPECPNRVVFFGSFAADFNRDALRFILAEVAPALRARRPEAELWVAGGGLSPGLAREARAAGAMVWGEVADVRALLLSAAVVLVPLRFGGGLRIRLLESLALERAVVGTPVGVLGMGPRAGHEVLAGETAEEVAEQTARALADPGLRAQLGRQGRKWVQEHHAPEAAARGQREIVKISYAAQK